MILKTKQNIELKIAFNKQLNFLIKFCQEFDRGNEDMAIMIAGVLRTLLNESNTILNYGSSLIKKTDRLKKLCENEKNFKDTSVYKECRKLSRSINSQISCNTKTQKKSNSLFGLLELNNVTFIDTRSSDPKNENESRFSGYKVTYPEGEDPMKYYDLMKEIVFGDNIPYSGLCSKLIVINKDHSYDSPRYYPHLQNRNYTINSDIVKLSFNEWWKKGIVLTDYSSFSMTREQLIKTVANKEGYAHVDVLYDQRFEFFNKSREIFITHGEKGSTFFENTPVGATIRQIAFETIYTIQKELSFILDPTISFIDKTPISFKLLFDAFIDDTTNEEYIISCINTIRPYIQKIDIKRLKKENLTCLTFGIYSIQYGELERILKIFNEKGIEVKNVKRITL